MALAILVRPAAAAVVPAAIALIYTLLTGEGWALLAAGFVLLALHATGALLLRPDEGRAPAIDHLLAFTLGAGILVGVMNVTAHFTVNTPVTWAAVLALPVVLRWRETRASARRLLQRIWTPRRWTRAESALVALVAGLCLIHWLLALKPEVSADGRAMHLVIADTIAHSRFWHFDTTQFIWAVMPMGGDWYYTAAYLLGGETASRLLNVSTLFAICLLLYHVARTWLGVKASLLICAVLLSNPLASLVSSSLFVENVWALLLLAALVGLWRFHETGERRYLWLSGFVLGAALATKLGALAAVLPMALLTLLAAKGKPKRAMALTLLLFFAVGTAPYVTAWWKTGNPAFPFMNAVFKAPGYPSDVSFVDSRYHNKPVGLDLLNELTFNTRAYLEAPDGGWGFHFYWLIPLTLLTAPLLKGFLPRAALFLSVAFFATTFGQQTNLRYIYPVMPVFLLATAFVLRQASARWNRLALAIYVALLALVPLNVYFLSSSGWYQRDFIFDPRKWTQSKTKYLTQHSPVRRLIEYANARYPNEPVMFVDTSEVSGFRGRAFTTIWHTYAFEREFGAATSLADAVRILGSHSIRHVIAPSDPANVDYPSRLLKQVLVQLAHREVSHGRLSLYTLKQPFVGPDGHLAVTGDGATAAIAQQGRAYDEAEAEVQYRGRWSAMSSFARAFNGTLSFSNSPGASVHLRFVGTGVTWIYTKAFNRGRAAVVIDGRQVRIVDQYSPEVVWQSRLRFDGLPHGEHYLEVRVLGEAAKESKDSHIDVDGFEIH